MPRTYRRKTDRPYTNGKPQDVPAAYVPGFIGKLDQRTELARLLRARFDSLATDLGGAESLSGIKASLLERLVFLEAALSRMEAEIAQAPDAKAAAEITARWVQATNALLGIAKTLGIERQAREVDLKTYVAANAAGDTEPEDGR